MKPKSIIFLVDSAAYGTEKAYGALHAAIVCLPHGATIGLYGDGVYLALADQDSTTLEVPNLSYFLYAYPEVRIIAHKESLEERGLMNRDLIELLEILDGEQFFPMIRGFNFVMLL